MIRIFLRFDQEIEKRFSGSAELIDNPQISAGDRHLTEIQSTAKKSGSSFRTSPNRRSASAMVVIASVAMVSFIEIWDK
jgi:hypothetical protein